MLVDDSSNCPPDYKSEQLVHFLSIRNIKFLFEIEIVKLFRGFSCFLAFWELAWKLDMRTLVLRLCMQAIAHTLITDFYFKILEFFFALKTGSHILKSFALYRWGETKQYSLCGSE